jgi:hypothetical protein
MKFARLSVVAVAIAALLVAPGCDKRVGLTFVNLTDEALAVHLAQRGQQPVPAGTVGDYATLDAPVTQPRDALPAYYHWSAGPHEGNIRITEQTADRLWIALPSGEIYDRPIELELHARRRRAGREPSDAPPPARVD